MAYKANYDGGFAINGTSIPCPKTCSVQISALDGDTGRTADGIMHRDVIRHAIRSVTVEFPPIPAGDAAKIIGALESDFFDFTFFDPSTGGLNTIHAYSGDRTVEVKIIGYAGGTALVEGLKFTAIEQ